VAVDRVGDCAKDGRNGDRQTFQRYMEEIWLPNHEVGVTAGDREFRRFKLSAQIVAKLKEYVAQQDLGRGALPVRAPAQEAPRVRKLRLVVDPETLGRTEPNASAAPIGTAP
jgi:hypothetical protein